MALTLRIGEGWDTHALVVGRPLVLGGVTITTPTDSTGIRTPMRCCMRSPTRCSARPRSATSAGTFRTPMLRSKAPIRASCWREAARRVGAAGWHVVNIDSTIVAQAPKMAPHIPAMRERIARALGIAVDQVNVKAKTAEKMGPVGEGRAIEARAVCLLCALEAATATTRRSSAACAAAAAACSCRCPT